MTDGAERMTMRRLRALRGGGAAALAVLFASTAHTLAGGVAPPPWLMAGVTILAAPLCTALVGRRRSLLGQASATAVAQIALHAAFAAVGAAAPVASSVGHGHDLSMLAGAALDPAMAGMTVGHAVAALATLLVLVRGEALVVALARGIRRVLRPTPPRAARRPVALPRVVATPPRAPLPVFRHVVVRRGPPARLAHALPF